VTIIEVLTGLVAGVAVLLLGATVSMVDRQQLARGFHNAPENVRTVLPHLALLVGVLVLNRAARHRSQDLSWVIGWNITGAIYAIEGNVVSLLQLAATPLATFYLSFAYLFGYAFLTIFPFVAYFALEDTRPLRMTILAYSLNYLLGLVCYVLFISYGPRNLIPGQVASLLYGTYPEAQLLTSVVNANTNVFPSLHASLSVTAALLARRTADIYPNWYRLSGLLTVSVVVATMYLGIHWAIDVVAGSLLALACVRSADRCIKLSDTATGMDTR